MHDGRPVGPVPESHHGADRRLARARLGTDYVDLYQIHRFETPRTPVDETMEALHGDVVKPARPARAASVPWS